jgi:hypothetical protein
MPRFIPVTRGSPGRTGSRRFLTVCALLAVLVLVSACGQTSTSPKDEKPQAALNLETLEAETEFGTLRAQRAQNSFVGLFGEGRAIGIAFLEEVGARDTQELQREIVVYLYERQCLALMIGSVDAEGYARLESDEFSDFEATVELTMEDDAVSGTVTFPGEEPTPFTADAATGVAGVYWARGTDQDLEVSGDWVVLSDGRQWGCVCTPPALNNPCCHLHR